METLKRNKIEMNIISLDEILDIHSYLKHLYFLVEDIDEKKNINNLLDRLKQVLVQSAEAVLSSTLDEEDMGDGDENGIIVKDLKVKIKESVLYENDSNKLKTVSVTITQNFSSNLFDIILDDFSEKNPFEVSVDSLDLNIEENYIRCAQTETEYFDLYLSKDYMESLINILNSNCDLE
jgi:hypothetical protein